MPPVSPAARRYPRCRYFHPLTLLASCDIADLSFGEPQTNCPRLTIVFHSKYRRRGLKGLPRKPVPIQPFFFPAVTNAGTARSYALG